MGKHGKGEDLNNKPYNESASPSQKAKEFDQQHGQNRRYTNTPNVDAQEKGKKP